MKYKIVALLNLFTLSLIILSCKQNNEDYSTLKPINYKDDESKYELYKGAKEFKDVFNEVYEISLDTAAKGIMADIYKIASYGEDIIAVDYHKVGNIKRYDKEGKYENDIGKNGRGPGEYKTPALVGVMYDSLIVYDDMERRVNVYNLNDNSFVRTWGVKNRYNGMAIIKNNIYLHRSLGNTSESKDENVFDSFNPAGDLMYTGNFPPYSNGNLVKLSGVFNLGFVSQGNNILVVCSDDLIINAFDVEKRKMIWRSNELPGRINVDQNSKSKKDNCFVHNLFAFNDGLIVLELLLIENNKGKIVFALYDRGGNYLSSINVAPGIYYADGKYLYYLSEPKKINNNYSNFGLKKYEIVKKYIQ